MDVLGQQLDQREDPVRIRADAETRARGAEAWMLAGADPADRLLKFDTWVRAKLEGTLDWSWAGAARARRIEQCRAELERLVQELWRRGWMLDGHRLAKHVKAALADVAAAQAAGRVRDFWPFYVGVVRRYVGVNAEEIRAEAMAAGTHVGLAMQAILRASTGQGEATPAGPSITELVALRRAELATRRRAEKAEEGADDGQARLL
jgi:hypothetical protein